MTKELMHEILLDDILEAVFLRNYESKGTLKANEEVIITINLIDDLDMLLNLKNCKQIRRKVFYHLDLTLVA